MVAVDQHGKPTRVPPLEIKDSLQECRQKAAQMRKELRFQSNNISQCDIK